MARKKSNTNPPPPSSDDKEEGSERNDAVKEEPETPVKGREPVSDLEDDYSENTAPSPNVSDFIIKPIVSETPEVNKATSKRPALIDPSGTHSKKEKFDPPPFVVLGLPIQDNKLALPQNQVNKKSGKKKMDSKAKENVGSEIDSKRMSELLRKGMLKWEMGNGLAALDVALRVVDDEKLKEIEEKRRKLQQQMLELYIKRLELVQEQTKSVLDKLESSEV